MNIQKDFPALGFGLGLRHPHIERVLAERPKSVNWFEILTENFLDGHEGHRDCLIDLRRDYPLVMHGVGMSIGGNAPLNINYIKRVRALADEIRAEWVSDHLCFTGSNGYNTHDLLPVPYTTGALRHIGARVRQAQDILGRALVLENPSTYVEFRASHIPEPEFLAMLAEDTGAHILLDVNNVYVSAFNHGYDARGYIDTIPADRVAQIHLAGFTHRTTHIIDTHDHPVHDEVWDLYAYAIQTLGFRSTMIEWDEAIPPFDELLDELEKARGVAQSIAELKFREAV